MHPTRPKPAERGFTSVRVSIYEVTLNVDPDIAAEYDTWLKQHVADMLALPGFLSVEISAIEGEETSRGAGRVVHYRLESRKALDVYFREHAAHMRDAGIKRFGNRVRASRRILQRPVELVSNIVRLQNEPSGKGIA